jgi:hypothetical protein
MASIIDDGVISQHYETILKELMNETPKITEAAKNVLSHELAKLTVNTSEKAEDSRKVVVFDAPELLSSIKLVLKCITNLQLEDPLEWGRKNSQKPEQSGIQRIEEITKYKAAYALWRRAKNAGQSPSKLLGKTFLQIIWTQVRHEVLTPVQQPITSTRKNETLLFVVEAFERSLDDQNIDSQLIWAADINKVVATRHKERQEKAVERLQEAERAQEEFRNDVVEQLES